MKKHAKTWTRKVIYISIFQVFHPTDVEIKVSKWFLSSIRRWSVFFFSVGTIFHEVFVVMLTIADLAMIMPLSTWYLIDSRVAEKEKLLKRYLFAQPWWSRLRSAFLVIRRISKVISRKLTGQIHGPYDSRYCCCCWMLDVWYVPCEYVVAYGYIPLWP